MESPDIQYSGITNVHSRIITSADEFYRDVKESIFHFMVTILVAVHIVCSYVFVCNFKGIYGHEVVQISNSLNLIRNGSFLIVGLMIIVALKRNRSNTSTEPIAMRNTIVLYFMIAPCIMIHWLNSSIEAFENIFLIRCPALMFSFLEVFEAFAVILILIMLNNIDHILSTNISQGLKIMNRSVALVIIASCFGIYLFQMILNFEFIFNKRISHFYNYTLSENHSCVIKKHIYLLIEDPIQKYKRYTSLAATCLSISTVFYLLSCFNWFFAINNYIRDISIRTHRKRHTSRNRLFLPIIVIIIIITLTLPPIAFFIVNKDVSVTALTFIFTFISKSLLILCYSLTIGLVVLMVREVKWWHTIKDFTPSMTRNQLFVWGGLLGQMLLFVGRMSDNASVYWYLPDSHTNPTDKMWSVNVWYNVLGILSMVFQTILCDIMIKKQYKAHEDFTIINTIQPTLILTGINFVCITNEFYNTVWSDEFTTVSENLFGDLMRMLGRDLGFLQRIHGFFFFLSYIG